MFGFLCAKKAADCRLPSRLGAPKDRAVFINNMCDKILSSVKS